MSKIGIPKRWFRVFSAMCGVAIAPIGTVSIANGQTTSPTVSFEVATVKPVAMDAAHPFNPKHFWAHITSAGAFYWSMTPASLIAYAYDVESFQVTGPEWTNKDRFDIEARFPPGVDKKDERRMLQALLQDRFKLTFHVEKRELKSYALVVGKHGSNLTPSVSDPVAPEPNISSNPEDRSLEDAATKSEISRNPDGSSTANMGKRGTQTVKFDRERWAMHYDVSKMTMEELAGRLRNCLGSGVHKVVNETGIEGTYQLAWDCPSTAPRPTIGTNADGSVPSEPQDSSSLAQSLEALGLKLEKRKVLQDVYVIDHVERPSDKN